jgi:hypothetical protein
MKPNNRKRKLEKRLALADWYNQLLKMSGNDIERFKARANIRLRADMARFLRRAFGWSLVATFGLYFCQGFHVLGFALSEAEMHWLGGATIGQIAGLLAVVVRDCFNEKRPKIGGTA